MTLENLLRIGRLKAHEPDASEIQRLLAAAHRSLRDAHITEVSAETRFDAAYKAIMQVVLVALMGNGFRPDTNQPGHHMTVIQSLPKSIGLSNEKAVVLDAHRRKRNVAGYTGDDVDDVSVQHCIVEAERLLESVENWLHEHRPDLLSR